MPGNLLKKYRGEPLPTYIRRLAKNMVEPDSELWRNFRRILGLSKAEWLNAFAGGPNPSVFPYPRTERDINRGHCECICDLLEMNFPGGEQVWIFPPGSRNPHKAYRLRGKLFDVNSPEGITEGHAARK